MDKSTLLKTWIELCSQNLGTIIFPEGEDERVIAAAKTLIESNAFKRIILMGRSGEIHPKLPSSLQSYLDKQLVIMDCHDAQLKKQTKNAYEQFLQQKGRPLDQNTIDKISVDPLYQAGFLLSESQADCVVAGAVATTANVIKAALSTVGLGEHLKTVSGSFLLERTTSQKHEILCFADSGVVIEPTAEQLVDIAYSSANTWKKIIGTTPMVGFLSFSTKGSATSPQSDKMKLAATLFKAKYPTIESDGELQFDAAFVESIGQRKAPGSPVAGKVNIFIFPDLNSGNIAYKITERLAGFSAYGPILQGLSKPYSDLSRGATSQDIVASALISRLRAI